MRILICLELMKPGQSHNEKVDVWPFGMVVYEITTNQIPYNHCENEMQILTAVSMEQRHPTFPQNRNIDPTLHDLMEKCWNWDPEKRPSIPQIVQTLKKVKSEKTTHT
jgi:serine/threonine protein kinase